MLGLIAYLKPKLLKFSFIFSKIKTNKLTVFILPQTKKMVTYAKNEDLIFARFNRNAMQLKEAVIVSHIALIVGSNYYLGAYLLSSLGPYSAHGSLHHTCSSRDAFLKSSPAPTCIALF